MPGDTLFPPLAHFPFNQINFALFVWFWFDLFHGVECLFAEPEVSIHKFESMEMLSPISRDDRGTWSQVKKSE